MLRFYLIIVKNLLLFPGVLKYMRGLIKKQPYSEEENYRFVRFLTRLMQVTGHIKTKVYGIEHLPSEGGYVMYPNHQGKYDGFSIVCGHKKPCTVVMDDAKSRSVFIREIIDLLRGKRMVITDMKQSVKIIQEVAEEVKAGRCYIIFPEGGYTAQKHNSLSSFKSGCFRASVKSRTPIVPVVLINSYKAFGINKLGVVTTQVHFLEPIDYGEYCGMKTSEIAELVKNRIQQKIDEVTE